MREIKSRCLPSSWSASGAGSSSGSLASDALLLHRSLRLFSPGLGAVGRHVADFATVEALERFALSLGSRVGRSSGASGSSRFRRAFDVSPLGV